MRLSCVVVGARNYQARCRAPTIRRLIIVTVFAFERLFLLRHLPGVYAAVHRHGRDTGARTCEVLSKRPRFNHVIAPARRGALRYGAHVFLAVSGELALLLRWKRKADWRSLRQLPGAGLALVVGALGPQLNRLGGVSMLRACLATRPKISRRGREIPTVRAAPWRVSAVFERRLRQPPDSALSCRLGFLRAGRFHGAQIKV